MTPPIPPSRPRHPRHPLPDGRIPRQSHWRPPHAAACHRRAPAPLRRDRSPRRAAGGRAAAHLLDPPARPHALGSAGPEGLCGNAQLASLYRGCAGTDARRRRNQLSRHLPGTAELPHQRRALSQQRREGQGRHADGIHRRLERTPTPGSGLRRAPASRHRTNPGAP